MVKNVAQTIKYKTDIDLSSEKIRAFGVDWSINVSNPEINANEEMCKPIAISLCALGNFAKE